MLKFHDPPEVIETKYRRLAAVPRKANDFSVGQLEMLDYVLLQQILLHAKFAGVRVEFLLL